MRITWFDKAFCPYISTLGCAMPRKVAVALTLMVSLSLMEGVGLLMLVPLLGLVGLDVSHGELGGVARFVSSAFRFAGILPSLITVLGVYVLIVSAHGLLQRWQAAVNADLNMGSFWFFGSGSTALSQIPTGFPSPEAAPRSLPTS